MDPSRVVGAIWVNVEGLHRASEDSLFLSVPVDYKWDIHPWPSTLMVDPTEGAVLDVCVLLGLWPWSCCSSKASSWAAFWVLSCPKALSKCSAMVTSSVRPVASQPIFCLYINPLISGYNPFTNRAARAGWAASFTIWNPVCYRKRISSQALKSITSYLFFVCLFE